MRLKAVLLLLLVCFVARVSAQDTTTWYYGWNMDTGEVFAYTAEGVVHILLEKVEDMGTIMPINDETAFGIFYLDSSPKDVENPYYLTPDEARALEPTFDEALLADEDLSFAIMDFTDDHAFFSTTYTVGHAGGMIADFQAGTLDVLGEFDIHRMNNVAAFSEDGLHLRYVRYDSADEDQWSLVERTLATGEERAFYSGESFPSVIADEYGEYWLARLPRQGEESVTPIIVLDTNGETRQVAETSPDNLIGATLFEDSVFTWFFDCTEDCVATLSAVADGVEQVFRSPAIYSTIIPIAHINEGHLLVQVTDSGEFYLLSEDEEPQLLGGYRAQSLGQPIWQLLSPDQRFLLLLTDEDEYGVWDFEQQEFVIRKTADDYVFALIFYGDGGFLVSNGLQTFDLYRYADDSVITLPEKLGTCFDVLLDGDVLCNNRSGENLQSGIYRYDPEADRATLLVEGYIQSTR